MAGKASTSSVQRATPVPAICRRATQQTRDIKELRRVRARILLIVLAIVILGVVGGLVYLGLNPPNPVSKPVEKTLPNDKFQVR
jgi:uncharacterized membrane protein